MKKLKNMSTEKLIKLYKKTKIYFKLLQPLRKLCYYNELLYGEIAWELGKRVNN